MKLWQYDNIELLHAAAMAHWMDDQKFVDCVMEELALRIMEEHPPDVPRYEGDTFDGEGLENEVEEGPEETTEANERRGRSVHASE